MHPFCFRLHRSHIFYASEIEYFVQPHSTNESEGKESYESDQEDGSITLIEAVVSTLEFAAGIKIT